MTTRATEVLTDHMYCDRLHVRRRRAIWSTPDKKPERPFLEAVEFTLAVAKHRDECDQQGNQEACVQEIRGYDDFLGRTLHAGRVAVESSEDRPDAGFRVFAGI